MGAASKRNPLRFFYAAFNAGFNFLASLQLAVLIIVILMIGMAAGTLLESSYGAGTARALVYQSPWFAAVLILLAANLAAAALDRFPWKKKHTGFVLTHLGIILILVGSLMTQRSMIDGQITLAEGETEKSITLPQPTLYLLTEQGKTLRVWDLKMGAFAWEGSKKLDAGDPELGIPEMNLRAIYPAAVAEEKYVASEQGGAALQIKVDSAIFKETFWLEEKNPERSEQQLGPAKITFKREKIAVLAAGDSKTGYLDIVTDQATYRLDLPETVQAPVTLAVPKSDLKVEIKGFFKNAVVGEKGLQEAPVPEGMKDVPSENPAIQLVVTGPNLEETHTVFARFPDFQSMHGGTEKSKLRIYHHAPDVGSVGGSEIRFVPQGNKVICQIQRAGEPLKEMAVTIGQALEPGWMDFKFTVLQFFPKAESTYLYHPATPRAGAEDQFPAIALDVTQNGKTDRIWLGEGIHAPVASEKGEPRYLLFGQKRIPAGFNLLLKDFRLTQYPGTQNPMSYESDVVLSDPMRGVVRAATISMNEPLDYRGFKIYQSGYNNKGEGPEVSIFSVSRDPGIPLKYIGTIVMVIGITLIFFFRKYSRSAGQL